MTVCLPDAADAAPMVTGLAVLAKIVFDQTGIDAHWAALTQRAASLAGHDGDLIDMATLLQLVGRAEQGLALQADALSRTRLYRRLHGSASGRRILVFMVAGDMMANTPLDFLLEGSDFEVHYLYVGADAEIGEVPDHDLAFVAIGESEANNPTLTALAPRLADWPRPTVNGRPLRIAALSRDGVYDRFRKARRLLAPAVVRADRAALASVAAGAEPLSAVLADGGLPIIVRPLGSHAGLGLSRIDGLAELADYLASRPEPAFYVSPFIDYRSADGRFRKYRIAFVRGHAFLAHLAISDHWMVHYLNAGMQEDAGRRAEEGRAMAQFDHDFAARHAAAFTELVDGIGLDYFAIDCSELADGRLLLFEADVAMILHAMDPPDLYPYKPAQMHRLFAAFQAMLADAAGR